MNRIVMALEDFESELPEAQLPSDAPVETPELAVDGLPVDRSGEAPQADTEITDPELVERRDPLESAKIFEFVDSIEEAQGVSTVLGSYTQQLDSEDVPEAAVRAMEPAVEHFRQRLQYPKKVVPALEAFRTDSVGVAQRQMLANLKQFQAVLDKNLQLAQEQLFVAMEDVASKAANRAEREKVNSLQVRNELAKLFNSMTGVKSEVHTSAPWARIFGALGKTEIHPNDVVALIHEIKPLRQQVLPFFTQAAMILKGVVDALGEGGMRSSDSGTARIKQLHGYATDMLKKLQEQMPTHLDRKQDVTMIPPKSVDEAKHIINEFMTSFNEGAQAIQSSFNMFISAARALNQAAGEAAHKRWHKTNAEDVQATIRLATEAINPVYDLMNKYGLTEHYVNFGVFKYIQATTH